MEQNTLALSFVAVVSVLNGSFFSKKLILRKSSLFVRDVFFFSSSVNSRVV